VKRKFEETAYKPQQQVFPSDIWRVIIFEAYITSPNRKWLSSVLVVSKQFLESILSWKTKYKLYFQWEKLVEENSKRISELIKNIDYYPTAENMILSWQSDGNWTEGMFCTRVGSSEFSLSKKLSVAETFADFSKDITPILKLDFTCYFPSPSFIFFLQKHEYKTKELHEIESASFSNWDCAEEVLTKEYYLEEFEKVLENCRSISNEECGQFWKLFFPLESCKVDKISQYEGFGDIFNSKPELVKAPLEIERIFEKHFPKKHYLFEAECYSHGAALSVVDFFVGETDDYFMGFYFHVMTDSN